MLSCVTTSSGSLGTSARSGGLQRRLAERVVWRPRPTRPLVIVLKPPV